MDQFPLKIYKVKLQILGLYTIPKESDKLILLVAKKQGFKQHNYTSFY